MEIMRKAVKSFHNVLEAPSGVEPLHRSFAVRQTTRRSLTIQSDRLRSHRSQIKRFAYFNSDQLLLSSTLNRDQNREWDRE